MICYTCSDSLFSFARRPAYTLAEIIMWLRGEVLTSEDSGETATQKLLVQRRRLLQHTLVAVANPSFCYDRLVEVKFSGEEADDWGGPRREYFT